MASSWTHAIVRRHPAARDHRDWVAPYLRTDRFDPLDWTTFWLIDIDGERVPFNRTIGLVTFHQAQHQKWDYGHGLDRLHAVHLLDCDLFATEDKGFHAALSASRAHIRSAAPVALVDRRASSPAAKLDEVIHGVQEAVVREGQQHLA